MSYLVRSGCAPFHLKMLIKNRNETAILAMTSNGQINFIVMIASDSEDTVDQLFDATVDCIRKFYLAERIVLITNLFDHILSSAQRVPNTGREELPHHLTHHCNNILTAKFMAGVTICLKTVPKERGWKFQS